MSGKGFVVAVVGAAGEVGRELHAVLLERSFPISEWRLFAGGEDIIDVDDEDLAVRVQGTDRIDLRGADLVFMCGSSAVSAEWAPRALDAKAMVVDLTQAFAAREDVPLVVPEVNPDAVAEAVACGIAASPVAGATALAVALNPLEGLAPLKRVVVACYEPVASAGRGGIEELAEQSRNMLSGRSSQPRMWRQRVAFNLIPQVGDFTPSGCTSAEWEIETQTRRLLDLPDLPIMVTAVRVPTFFGQGYAVNVETGGPVDAAEARAILRQAPGVVMHEDEAGGESYPTLVEVVGSEATHVGRVRQDTTVPHGLCLWVAVDGMRKGAAVNAVQIAERIIGDGSFEAARVRG